MWEDERASLWRRRAWQLDALGWSLSVLFLGSCALPFIAHSNWWWALPIVPASLALASFDGAMRQRARLARPARRAQARADKALRKQAAAARRSNASPTESGSRSAREIPPDPRSMGDSGTGPATRLEGVHLSEVLARGTGLYEVTTSSGVPVRLHDMSLVRVEHDPDRRRLVMEFLYDDPEWTPDAARKTPLAVFAFDDVEVLEQDDDPPERDTPEAALGQVQGFDYDLASGIFALYANTRSWVFTASGLALTLRPATEG